jgi:hypothetical protein
MAKEGCHGGIAQAVELNGSSRHLLFKSAKEKETPYGP